MNDDVRDGAIPGAASPSIGHVHLRVADLDRAIAFYRDALGLTVTAYGPAVDLQAAFLAWGDYHHQIGLNTWLCSGGSAPPDGQTGLHHVAFVYPDRHALGQAVRRVLDAGHTLDSAEDHCATVSVYLRDPDGNGIELYYDRPRSAWFDEGGLPVLRADPFDPLTLLQPDAAEIA